ncbi:MAG: hypothetical protein CME07_05900 [Gemmatimonadetes bacterium]|nr:hypothetical protein [Gemmatimonadota bacterium]
MWPPPESGSTRTSSTAWKWCSPQADRHPRLPPTPRCPRNRHRHAPCSAPGSRLPQGRRTPCTPRSGLRSQPEVTHPAQPVLPLLPGRGVAHDVPAGPPTSPSTPPASRPLVPARAGSRRADHTGPPLPSPASGSSGPGRSPSETPPGRGPARAHSPCRHARPLDRPQSGPCRRATHPSLGGHRRTMDRGRSRGERGGRRRRLPVGMVKRGRVLARLESDIAFCERCYGPEKTLPVRFERPAEQPELLILGERPPRRLLERDGRLGTGGPDPGTRFLRNLLEDARIPRTRILMASAMLCRPASRELEAVVPPAACVRACASHVRRLVEAARPPLIVVLGHRAVRSVKACFPKEESLRKLRFPAMVGQAVPLGSAAVVPLYQTTTRARVTRPAEAQKRDWKSIGTLYHALAGRRSGLEKAWTSHARRRTFVRNSTREEGNETQAAAGHRAGAGSNRTRRRERDRGTTGHGTHGSRGPGSEVRGEERRRTDPGQEPGASSRSQEPARTDQGARSPPPDAGGSHGHIPLS